MNAARAFVLLALVAAASLGPAAAAVLGSSGPRQPAPILEDSERKWWETAVIYQIYPRSFKDSNGDGVGDLEGITSKLEYLQELGVGAVWLSPIYPSPQADFGYDIKDFKAIDETYGSMDDFKTLLNKAHSLGLRVVLDFVPNHSSDEHEWFKKSVEKIDPYTNYYVWHDGKGPNVPPNNWISMFRGSAWKWNDVRQQWYMHQFLDKQPDLNYRDPNLVKEMKDAIKFWLDMGVDGFRVDAVWTLFEDEELRDEPLNEGATDPKDRSYLKHIYTENQNGTYDMVSQWRQVLDGYDGDRIMMTEAYSTLDETVAYYGSPTKPGASFPFNFNLITSLGRSSNATDFKNIIDAWMSKMNSFRKPNWVMGNHDQNRVGSFARYGPELVDGISMISLMLPGTAMTYNGEEIGMEDTFIKWEQTKDPQALNAGEGNYLAKSRDLERTPFQWDDSAAAGFSDAKDTWLPVNPNYWRINLKAERAASRSHLKVYKALLQARKEPAVQSQEYSANVIGEALVITRQLSGHDTFIVVVNLGSELSDVSLSDLGKYSSDTTLRVWTSSLNSDLQTGNSVTWPLTLRPKEGLVLTTGSVKSNSSSVNRATAALSLFPALAAILLRSTLSR